MEDVGQHNSCLFTSATLTAKSQESTIHILFYRHDVHIYHLVVLSNDETQYMGNCSIQYTNYQHDHLYSIEIVIVVCTSFSCLQ